MGYYIKGVKEGQEYILSVAESAEQAETFRQQLVDEKQYDDYQPFIIEEVV